MQSLTLSPYCHDSEEKTVPSKWKRYVVGPDQNGKSATLMTEVENYQENPGIFYRATLWGADEIPHDNSITIDRANAVKTREPTPGGFLFRALEIPPDTADKTKHVDALTQLNKQVQQKHQPTAEDLARHPACIAPTRSTASLV